MSDILGALGPEEVDAYYRGQGLVLDKATNTYIKAPADDSEEAQTKRRKELAALLADRVLSEEATTGQPSQGRDLLGHMDAMEVAHSQGTVENVPKDTLHEIWSRMNPDPIAPAESYMAEQPKKLAEMSPTELHQIWENVQKQSNPDYVPRPYEPPAPEPTFLEQLQNVNERMSQPVRQYTGNLLGSAAALPNDLMAALYGGSGIIADKIGFPNAAQNYKRLAEGFNYTSAGARRESKQLMGADEKPQNTVDELAGLLGGNSIPAGKLTKPLAATMTGIQYGVTHTVAPAQAAKKVKDEEAQRLQMDADAEHVIETIGGPAKVRGTDLGTMTGLAAITMGMIFAPTLYSKFKTGILPRLGNIADSAGYPTAAARLKGQPVLRDVPVAAPGTKAMSNVGDLARTYDDVNAGVLRLAKRAGVAAPVLESIDKTFRIQTRGAANSIADSAVVLGHAETPMFAFKSKIPLATLAQAETPEVANYLHLRDTIDDLLLAQTKLSTQSVQKQAQFGPPVVRGLDIQTALQQLGAMERANPQLKQISKAYQDNLKAMRKFESTGEYSTLSKANLSKLNQERSNMVPFKGQRVMDDPRVNRGSPFQSLADEMQVNLRQRMENEAVGQYIDAVRKVQPDLFRRVTSTQLKDNPHWRDNTVTMYRRGKPEHYTTDPFLADVLKLDPYFMSSTAQNLLYSTKRLLEKGSTGELAPWFAVTSMLRNYQIGKLTAPVGLKSPSALGTVAAIPQQLIPQMAKNFSEALDRGSAGWLTKVLGPANTQALSVRLAQSYENSLYARLQTAGTHTGSIMEQQTQAQNRFTQALSQMHGPVKQTWEGYRSLLSAVHNAPSFSFARRNESRLPLNQLAMEARNLTGDPRIGGQYYAGTGRPIRLEGTGRVSHTVTKTYGALSEGSRASIPWFNATEQGMKRIGAAYVQNPAAFTGRAWLYTMMPAATFYLSARALGKDPNGMDYVDYMMNRRSAYQQLMNYYIPIPGRPAEEGIEFPRFHEMAGAARMMEIGLDHALRSSIFPESEDIARAAKSFGSTALIPPAPPIINAAFASQGMSGPQGVFGGEAYKKRSDPFDQSGGMPSSLELYVRALAGGIGDIIGTSAAAYSQTEEGFLRGIGNAISAGGKRAVSKTPLLRDVTGVKSPASGNTDIVDELFKKQRGIDQLLAYEKTSDSLDEKTATSKSGGVVAEKLLGAPIPREIVGYTPPEPTNPLYKAFADEVHNKFKKDALRDQGGNETGAIGFRSIWKRYGDATKQVRSMAKINEGNNVTWGQSMESDEKAEQRDYLKENGINYKNPVAVRNHYERVRQDAARVILFTIRSVEDTMSKKIGKAIKLEDLDPYAKPSM